MTLDGGCADAWSPKVLRAATGGHFRLSIQSHSSLTRELETFSGKLIATVARGGTPLGEADLSGRLGWLLGSEGKGLSAAALAQVDLKASIPTAVGTESLNVAAAAAVCFYAGANRPGAGS